MQRSRMVRLTIALVMFGALFAQIAPVAADAPSNGAFRRTWERTDKPVADLQATRTWIWGPGAFSEGLIEPYVEAPGGQREVQYFDKSRMELTHPGGDPSSAFYVTNGLLVVELITGRMQFGDATFQDFTPADVNVAGDVDDAGGPTYATFGALLSDEPPAVGSPVTQRVNRAGQVSYDPALAGQDVSVAYFDENTQHAIAAPFWDFMNAGGVIYENGQFTNGALFSNPFFATGRPITGPYWADVKVGGAVKLVLVQCFERRCLTYTPDNAPEWRVEAGNVGQHYYSWRYAVHGMLPQHKPAPRIPTEASWSLLQPTGATPSARRDHVLVADASGQKVYLHGGRAGDSVLGDLWVYDVAANSWAQLAPSGESPSVRFGHNGAFDSLNQRLLVFGGQAGTTFYSDLWAYDVASNSWIELVGNGVGPLNRYGAGGAFDPVSGSFYVSHGFTSNGRFDDTWGYNVNGGWSDISAAGARPEERCLLRVVADPARGRLLLFGGQSNTSPYLGDLWAYNIASRGWQQISGPGPSPRNFYAMTLAGDGAYALLYGGNAGGSASSELWLLDLEADTWTLLPAIGPSPPSRSGHDMVWLAGRNTALSFGGGSAELWRATFN
jgi:hypothetical protein